MHEALRPQFCQKGVLLRAKGWRLTDLHSFPIYTYIYIYKGQEAKGQGDRIGIKALLRFAAYWASMACRALTNSVMAFTLSMLSVQYLKAESICRARETEMVLVPRQKEDCEIGGR